MSTLADPRTFPLAAPLAAPVAPEVRQWHAWTDESLASSSSLASAQIDARLEASITAALSDGQSERVIAALLAAPSAAVYRHLWRVTVAAWRARTRASDSTLVAHGFAVPVVVVCAADQAVELPGRLRDAKAIVELMQQHGALGGNRNFGVADRLAGVKAVGLDSAGRWPGPDALLAHPQWIDAIETMPIPVAAANEGAHLRFLLGSALASPNALLFDARTAGAWGVPVAKALSEQLGVPGVQLLALPGAPGDILSVWQQGLLSHREIALQLFASSVIRSLRSRFGEPSAVISAHRSDAASGGELRLSLSSQFGERDAEGFRVPLYPFEQITDVRKSIADLLSACRLSDINVLPGIHPERNRGTGLPLFFRADALPPR